MKDQKRGGNPAGMSAIIRQLQGSGEKEDKENQETQCFQISNSFLL